MSQLMPLPLTVSCFSEIQIGFTFLVPAHPGSPGKRAVKWYVCVCVCVCDFVVNRLFMKLFKTSNIDVVKCCQDYFGFDLPSMSWSKRVKKFDACNNLLCRITQAYC